MIHHEPILLGSVVTALQHFVTLTKLHPILVNFTAALVPMSVASDAVGYFRRNESLRHTAWWTLWVATILTPFTAITGWLFWMSDDNGVTGMTIHKWLGTSLVFLLFGLFAWRRNLHRRKQWPTAAYLVTGAVLVLALVVQGHLGGQQVFSDM